MTSQSGGSGGLSDTFFAASQPASTPIAIASGASITPAPRSILPTIQSKGDWSTTLLDGALLVPVAGLYLAAMTLSCVISGGNVTLDTQIWCENNSAEQLSQNPTLTADGFVRICGTAYMALGDGFGIFVGNSGPGAAAVWIRSFNLARVG